MKGLLSDDSGKTFQRWIDLLGAKSVNGNPVIFPMEGAAPYHVYYKVLNAKDFGVPQNRERVFIVGIRDDADNNFSWPKPFPLEKRLKDVLEDEVDEKYYLSDKMLELLTYGKVGSTEIANINKGGQKGSVVSEDGSHIGCLSATDYKLPKLVQVKSATSKGYEIAKEGDSINLSQPNSETRRGRVGKEVAQTLDTSCNQAVMIGAFRGRNPENTNDRTTGAPMQQRLEINKHGTSNTITSVQKDNVVVINKDLFNSKEITIFNGGLNNKENERNTFEILRILQQEIGEKEIKTWGSRILEAIREKEILWKGMYEKSISRETEEASSGIINKIQQSEGKQKIAQIIMRSLSKEKWERCSPQRRKSIKQLIKKLDASLSKLPYEDAPTKSNLQCEKLRYTRERIGLLREALSEIQKARKRINNENDEKRSCFRIRRLTVRESFRLMDFPDTFKWPVSNSQAYKQAGNSIVVEVLAQIISKLKL